VCRSDQGVDATVEVVGHPRIFRYGFGVKIDDDVV
jgi:hypothetical protein